MTKPLTEFHRLTRAKDGRQADCKVCRIASVAEWRDCNREKYRAQVLVSVRKYQAQRADPLYAKLVSAAVNAVSLGQQIEQFTSADLQAYWQANGIDPSRCYYTGAPLGETWHIDHKTPFSRGGAHAVWNIVPCTAKANLSKGTKTAEEYLSRLADQN